MTLIASVPPPLRESKAADSSSKRQHPTRREWEKHKPTILSLYHADSRMKLRQIVQYMGENCGFWATEAMYKLRLQRWQARRNKRKSAQHPIATSSPSPGSASQPAMANWNSEAGVRPVDTSEPLMNPRGGPVAMIFSHSIQGSDGANGMASQDKESISDPTTSSNATCILTSVESVSSREAQQAEAVPAGDDMCCDNPDAIHKDWQSSNAYHHGQHTSAWYSPDSIFEWIDGSSSSMHLDLYHNGSTHIGQGRDVLEGYPLMAPPAVKANPGEFIRLSLVSCTLHSKRNHGAAKEATVQAFKVYGQLVEQNHRHTLTSLNAIMIMLLDYTRGDEAIEVVAEARKAALGRLHMNHPLVQTIDYMMFQASGDYAAIQVNQMRSVYESFCSRLTPRHPHSLVAGYELAWRMAVDQEDETGQLEALGLLDKIETDSDRVLGTRHMHSIAIRMTKSRVLYTLREFPRALKAMSEAMKRTRCTYSPRHPYHLKAKTWYAPLLFSAYRDDEAESEWVAVALGRVELLGRGHFLSKQSIQEAEDFFFTTQRQSQAMEFRARLKEAEIRSQRRKPELVCPPVE